METSHESVPSFSPGKSHSLSELQQMVYEEYVYNGYCGLFNEAEKILQDYSELDPMSHLISIAEIGLVMTEAAEAIEDVRNGKKDHIGEELADAVIRVLNFATRKGINIEREIMLKHERNMLRGKFHGRQL